MRSVKHILISCIFFTCFAGCLPRALNKWAEENYHERINTPVKQKSDYITITTSLASPGNKVAAIDRKTVNMLPLLFYWKWNSITTCVLNSKIPVNTFAATVIPYANKKLKEKLNGSRVEFSVDKVPNTFSIDRNNHLADIIVIGVNWGTQSLQPVNSDMVVSYKIIKMDNTIEKTGIITIPDTSKNGVVIGLLRESIKPPTFQYFYQYDANITAMAKLVVDKLVSEL